MSSSCSPVAVTAFGQQGAPDTVVHCCERSPMGFLVCSMLDVTLFAALRPYCVFLPTSVVTPR